MKQINIDTPIELCFKGIEIDPEKSDLSKGKIVFKESKSKYPMSVKEIKGRDWYINYTGDVDTITNSSDINNLKTRELAEAFLALMQLKTICDEWNRIDGFVVDWTNKNQVKHAVLFESGRPAVLELVTCSSPIVLKDRATTQLFLDSFKDMIEIAKPLL